MASWKKVIVSGSTAELLTVSSSAVYIQNGQLLSAPVSTTLSGSFSGSFAGNGANITGIISSSYAANTSFANNFTVAGTLTAQTIVVQTLSSSISYLTGSTRHGSSMADTHQFTGSVGITGSIAVTPGVVNQLTASYAITASYVAAASSVANALTLGTGLIGASYNGSAAVTTAISGAAGLTTNLVPKWTGTGFTNSNITDTGTQVQVGSGASSGLSVAAGGISVTGNSTFNNDLTVTGNLTVNGSATLVNSTNTYIKDQFLQIASGSTALTDAGIIAQYNASGSGSAFFLESTSTGTYGRWAVAYDLLGTATAATADEWLVTTKVNASAPGATAPTWGGATNGIGNMWVTTAGDIFIYA